MRILLVDDSPVMRRYIARTLEMTGLGIVIEEAANGVEALARARAAIPSLIITDLNMPEMSGEELIRRVSEDERLKDIPVLALAADISRCARDCAPVKPMNALRKPVSPETLRAKVVSMLESAFLEPAVRETVQQALETMFYCAPAYRQPEAIGSAALGAAIDFAGPLAGRAHILVEEGLATRFASDFLAVDHVNVGDTMRRQTVAELANIICARVLQRWFPDAPFQYSMPFEAPRPERPECSRFCFSVLGSQPDFAIDFVFSER